MGGVVSEHNLVDLSWWNSLEDPLFRVFSKTVCYCHCLCLSHCLLFCCFLHVTAASLCCQPCVTICLPPSRPFARQPTGDPAQALDHSTFVNTPARIYKQWKGNSELAVKFDFNKIFGHKILIFINEVFVTFEDWRFCSFEDFESNWGPLEFLPPSYGC